MFGPNRTYTLSELLEVAKQEISQINLSVASVPPDLDARVKLWAEVQETIQVMKTWDAQEGLDAEPSDADKVQSMEA